MYMITKCPIFVRSAYLTQWTILTPLCPKVQSSSSDRVFVFFPSMYILLQRICQTYRTTHMLELFTTYLLPFLSFFFFIKKYDNSVSMQSGMLLAIIRLPHQGMYLAPIRLPHKDMYLAPIISQNLDNLHQSFHRIQISRINHSVSEFFSRKLFHGGCTQRMILTRNFGFISKCNGLWPSREPLRLRSRFIGISQKTLHKHKDPIPGNSFITGIPVVAQS